MRSRGVSQCWEAGMKVVHPVIINNNKKNLKKFKPAIHDQQMKHHVKEWSPGQRAMYSELDDESLVVLSCSTWKADYQLRTIRRGACALARARVCVCVCVRVRVRAHTLTCTCLELTCDFSSSSLMPLTDKFMITFCLWVPLASCSCWREQREWYTKEPVELHHQSIPQIHCHGTLQLEQKCWQDHNPASS